MASSCMSMPFLTRKPKHLGKNVPKDTSRYIKIHQQILEYILDYILDSSPEICPSDLGKLYPPFLAPEGPITSMRGVPCLRLLSSSLAKLLSNPWWHWILDNLMAFNLGMLIKPILVLQTLNVPSKVVLAFRTDTKFQGVLRPWHSLFRSGQRSWKGPWRWPSPEADRQKRSHREATGSCNPIYPSCVHTYSVYVYIYIYWLVVPIHGKKMFQTTNQYIYIYCAINQSQYLMNCYVSF